MKIKEINQHNTFSIIIILLLILGDIFCYYFSYYMVLNILNIPSIIDFPILIIFGIGSVRHYCEYGQIIIQ